MTLAISVIDFSILSRQLYTGARLSSAVGVTAFRLTFDTLSAVDWASICRTGRSKLVFRDLSTFRLFGSAANNASNRSGSVNASRILRGLQQTTLTLKS